MMEKGVVVFLLVLLQISIVWGAECGSHNIAQTLRLLDAPVQQMIISDDYKTIYLLTSAGTLYKSKEAGEPKVWINQKQNLLNAMDNPTTTTLVLRKIIKAANGKIYILGSTGVYWTSVSGSDQYYAYNRYLLDIKPHPEKGDFALATTYSDSCSTTKIDCYLSLLVTSDFGKSWTPIKNYIFNWGWGSGNTIYAVSIAAEDEKGPQAAIFQSQRRFFVLKNLGDLIDYQSPLGYTNYFYSNNFLYISVLTDTSDLNLLMSSDGGYSYYSANFSDPVIGALPSTQSAYQILDNYDFNTYINVQLTSDMRYGAIYQASSYDADFWISLRYNRIDVANRLADFVKYNGLNGIYFANRYNISVNVPNNNIEPYLETLVSFDKGGVWSRLKLPEESTCTESDCALHLYGPVDTRLPQILSDDNALGLVLATGNEGVYRSMRLDNSGTYLSRNAGFTWEKIRDGINQYAFGDFGALFVISSIANVTNQIGFSWDQGLTWSDCEFSSEYWGVTSLTTLGDSSSRSFILIGQKENSGVVVTFDLINTMTDKCQGETTPELETSNYEVFTSATEGICLLGRRESYIRRKRDASCYVESFERKVYNVSNCACTRQDYQCDGDCFIARRNQETGETICYNTCTGTDKDPTVPPANCTGIIQLSQGYRKITGDTCVGGEEWEPISYKCSASAAGNVSSSTETEIHYSYTLNFFSFALLLGTIVSLVIIIAIIGLFVAYRKNDRLNEIMSPYIPAWCTNNKDEEDAYGKIDPSTTNSLLDDELYE